MSGGVSASFSGNLTRDPHLRILANGTAVANFAVAVNERAPSKETGEWTNISTTFVDVTAWSDTGANACQSLRRGDRVLVTGTLRTRDWTTKDGVVRTSVEVRADTVAVDLMRQTVKITKVTREQVDPDSGEATTPSDDLAAEAAELFAGQSAEAGEAVPF